MSLIGGRKSHDNWFSLSLAQIGRWIIWTCVLLVTRTAHVKGVDRSTTRDVYLRVTTVLIEPYVMERVDADRKHSNKLSTQPPQYRGYIVDLLDRLTAVLGLEYRLYPVQDGTFGYRQSSGTWDGMIGELLNKRADLAAGPLYATKQRRQVVDFSLPFLDVHATILLRRPTSDSKPRIRAASDLLKQSRIKYGTMRGGLELRTLRSSNNSLHRRLWRKMRRFPPEVMTHTNADGIEMARKKNFAYILPTTIGEYISRKKPCDLITVDKFLMNESYAFALPRPNGAQSTGLLPQLNRVLLSLKANGFLDELYEKWWEKENDCHGIQSDKIYSPNPSKPQENGASDLIANWFVICCTLVVLNPIDCV